MKSSALQYAVRIPIILKHFGQLCVALAALTVVPLSVSLYFGDYNISERYALVIGVLVVLGVGLSRLTTPSRVQANEGMVIVTLIFLFGPLVMTYPMMGTGLAFTDALFEAVSGVTTTGLSTLPSVEGMSQTFLFARAWMQWYGGLGIMVLSLALVAFPGVTAKGLAATEDDPDDLVGSTQMHARRTIIVYGVLTALGLIAVWAMGLDFFHAILYVFPAISTGGFAPQDTSLAKLWFPIQTTILLISFLGAIPLALYHQLYTRRWHRTVNLSQVLALIISTIFFTLLFAWSLWSTDHLIGWNELLSQASLMVISAQTTAGFSTMDLASLEPGTKLSLIPAMIVGGGSGSTAGGIKLLRLLIVVHIVHLLLIRTGLSKNAVSEPMLENRPLRGLEIQHAFMIILLFLGIVFLSWVPFVIHGYDPIDSLFDVVSATATVGLSVGVVSQDLPTLLKYVLCIDMLLGRLEILAWFVLLYPGTWLGRRPETL